MAPPGQPRTSQGLRAGYLYVLGLRFALLYDVAASMVLTVAVAAIYSELDVAASFWLAVAAAALGLDDPRAVRVDSCPLLSRLVPRHTAALFLAESVGSPWVRSPGRQWFGVHASLSVCYFSPHFQHVVSQFVRHVLLHLDLIRIFYSDGAREWEASTRSSYKVMVRGPLLLHTTVLSAFEEVLRPSWQTIPVDAEEFIRIRWTARRG